MTTTWRRDNSKSLDYRHSSTCCDTDLYQQAYVNGKKLTKEETQLVIIANNKNPKKAKYISYAYTCTACDNKDNGKWQFKHWFRSPEE